MTYQLTVVYHHPDDVDAFDRHYAEHHAPLAASIPGVRSYTTSRPDPGPDGARAEHLVAVLLFDDAEAFAAGMGSETGQAAAADVPTFATGGASLMSGEVVTYV